MNPSKRAMVWINVLGGIAVLGSYAYGFLTHPDDSGALWGAVPPPIRPLYTAGMICAALGYFAFTNFLLQLEPENAQLDGTRGYVLLNGLYVGILLPSALWMPLTFAMLSRPSPGLWYAIRVVLAMVGLSSMGLMAALISLKPCRPGWAYWLALAGSAAFVVQTVLLDALVWPAYFTTQL